LFQEKRRLANRLVVPLPNSISPPAESQETNPFLRPFANSNEQYFAMQASPALMDFIGKRRMTSEHPFPAQGLVAAAECWRIHVVCGRRAQRQRRPLSEIPLDRNPTPWNTKKGRAGRAALPSLLFSKLG
jgi:hypothetical protein